MPVFDLSQDNSVLNIFVSELRDVEIQHDPIRFRTNLARIGEVMAYEISKTFSYKAKSINTPLASHDATYIKNQLVIGTILRAGLPFHVGFLNYFDRAENAFVSAYRKYTEKDHFDIDIDYISSPGIDGKTLILVDPMLATGNSLQLAYEALLRKGKPSTVHFACVIASQAGVDYLKETLKQDQISLWCGAIDAELNSKSYIVPGLGDAGDLAYGIKT
jgi:uracil phosphoribosyltransferase